MSRSSPRSAASANAVCGGDADRGRAADGEHADRLCNLGGRLAAELDLLIREPSLVEHDDGVVLEADDLVRLELSPSSTPPTLRP